MLLNNLEDNVYLGDESVDQVYLDGVALWVKKEVEILPDTIINIWFDNSGSMNRTLRPLKTMVANDLKTTLLPYYENNETKYSIDDFEQFIPEEKISSAARSPIKADNNFDCPTSIEHLPIRSEIKNLIVICANVNISIDELFEKNQIAENHHASVD